MRTIEVKRKLPSSTSFDDFWLMVEHEAMKASPSGYADVSVHGSVATNTPGISIYRGSFKID
ncbi:hypothetical protein Y710_00290 [Gordonia sp. QH-12]|nr:hypothetical protein Y710_00290 [Gordonia sp. QH-12]